MQINGVSANVRAIDGSDRRLLSDIPHHDVVVPTSGDHVVWILLIKFNAKHFKRMAVVSSLRFQLMHKLSSLLVIYSDDGIGSSRKELCSIVIIIAAHELVQFIIDLMK